MGLMERVVTVTA